MTADLDHSLAQRLAAQGDVPIPLFDQPHGATVTALADQPTPSAPQPPTPISAGDRRLNQALIRVLSSHIAPTALGFVIVSLRAAITAHLLTEAALARAAISPTDELTDRELQMLRGMSEGKTNEELARTFYVAIDTVKSHNRKLFKKLGARDRAQAVHRAWERGLLGGNK